MNLILFLKLLLWSIWIKSINDHSESPTAPSGKTSGTNSGTNGATVSPPIAPSGGVKVGKASG